MAEKNYAKKNVLMWFGDMDYLTEWSATNDSGNQMGRNPMNSPCHSDTLKIGQNVPLPLEFGSQ